MKKYYVYLKINNEKTGDFINTDNEEIAITYFANKKQITIKEWKNIYYIKNN